MLSFFIGLLANLVRALPLAGLALAGVAALHQLCSRSILDPLVEACVIFTISSNLVEAGTGVLGHTGAFPEQAVSWAVAALHAEPLLPFVGDSFHLLRFGTILAIGNELPPPPPPPPPPPT